MQLDFTTLYVIILLNSVGFTIVWALVSLSYRSVHSARYWFTALVMTCLGGPLLALGEGSLPLTYAGNLLVIGSFAVIWQGIRVFSGQKPLWNVVGVLLALSAGTMMAFGSSREANNIIVATSQLVPVILTILALLRSERRYLGIWVAAGAGAILVLGQGAEAVTNAFTLAGLMSIETYYAFAAWFLVCTIIGASVWNLGFLLMVADRLRAELHSLAARDDLTGLPNRRALRERISLCEDAARRTGQTVAVLMVDLDRFKAINDDHGHDAGDAALVHVATVMKPFLRHNDFLSRVGGDEFCLLLPNSGLAEATFTADQLTEAITGQPLHWRGRVIDLAASIGLMTWEPASSAGLAESLPLADRALVGRKKNGRNGYAIYNPDSPPHRQKNPMPSAPQSKVRAG